MKVNGTPIEMKSVYPWQGMVRKKYSDVYLTAFRDETERYLPPDTEAVSSPRPDIYRLNEGRKLRKHIQLKKIKDRKRSFCSRPEG